MALSFLIQPPVSMFSQQALRSQNQVSHDITPRAQVLNVALQQDQYKVWVFVVEFLDDDNDDDA